VSLLADILERFSNGLVARYGHPVYLVGSALDVALAITGYFGAAAAFIVGTPPGGMPVKAPRG
jgi:hypothetical protein